MIVQYSQTGTLQSGHKPSKVLILSTTKKITGFSEGFENDEILNEKKF